MNGIEKIIQRIDSDTQKDVDALLAQAKAEAAEITAQFARQAQQEREALSAQNQQAAAEREERLVSVAQMESRKVTLGAKQQMVEQAFALAEESLCKLPKEQYIALLAKLLSDAGSEGDVVFSEKDAKEVGAEVVKTANALLQGGKLNLSAQSRPMDGGFILVGRQTEVNATFSTLVRLQRSQCAGEVARCLFPGE